MYEYRRKNTCIAYMYCRQYTCLLLVNKLEARTLAKYEELTAVCTISAGGESVQYTDLARNSQLSTP